MILKLIKLYIVEVTRLLSQKNHSICLCRFRVISIFVKFIGNFLTLLRQSWPLMLGHLTLPTPLNQCCNQTWYAMKFARRVHSNTTLKGGKGRMELEYLKKKKKKKKKLNYVQVSQLFLSKIVVPCVTFTFHYPPSFFFFFSGEGPDFLVGSCFRGLSIPANTADS